MRCFKVKNAQRWAALFVASLIVCGMGLLGTVSQAYADEVYDVTVEGTYHQTEAYSMLAMVNKFRTANVDFNNGNTPWQYDQDNNKVAVKGLSKLKWSTKLEKIAMQRAAECALRFDHTRPNGTAYWTLYTDDGSYPGGLAGENIAEMNGPGSHKSAQAAFEGWREDDPNYDTYLTQGHRRAMLWGVTSVGIACFEADGQRFWSMELADFNDDETPSLIDSSASVSTTVSPGYFYDTVSFEPIAKSLKTGRELLLPTEVKGQLTGPTENKVDLTANISQSWQIKSGNNVIELNGSTVTGLKVGTAVLSNTALGKEVTYTVTVKDKDTPEITGFETSKTVKLSEKGFSLSAKCSSGTTPGYSSSDASVATVSSTGVVTLKKAGTAKITVSFPGTDDYEPANATMALSVTNDSGWVPNGNSGNSWTTPDGSTVTIVPAATVSAPAKTAITKVSKAKKAFTVKWKKKSGVTGYQIRYSLKSSMKGSKTVTVKSAKTTSKKVSKLKKKKKYYMQVRTYKVVNGKTYWSGWSAKKSVKTK